ncbi:hypothetical protein CDL15_Pgr024871 [Punica granatum]|uniref:Retrotransposon gag domain-containing protein n=1 Tax=Punica granatum TaxID=22663 RepID=A0A218Y2L4_PUNGR|nr:hypothetical protein CDL15_Pgr024871 [Punica granatum]
MEDVMGSIILVQEEDMHGELDDFHLKRIPIANGSRNVVEFLEWISDVDKFFDYYDIPDDGSRVDRVYRLRGKASTWWNMLQRDHLKNGKVSNTHMEAYETIIKDWIPANGI